MIRQIEAIILYSQNATKLAQFYHKTVGIKIGLEAKMGEGGEAVINMKLSKGSGFYIIDHSKVKGKNKQPERMMINFEVDNIEKEVTRLKKAKVKIIQEIYHVEDFGYIATFADPDGNYFQLVKTRP